MTREELADSIIMDCIDVEKMFTRKNEAYGSSEDAFYNFSRGAEMLYGETTYETKFKTLMAYVSKHLVTILKPGAILTDKEFMERCMDVAVYMLIARAMKKEILKIESEEPKNV